MTKPGYPPVFLDIVEEHFDELDFLWEHREANVFTPDWTLADLAEHEERAEAHLDGLRLAELHAVDLARDKLTSGEPFAATAAALVLHESGAAEHLGLVSEALRRADPPVVEGIRVALRHGALPRFLAELSTLLASSDPHRVAAAADLLAFHGQEVPRLDALLANDDPAPRCLLLAAAGRRARLGVAALDAALGHVDPRVRATALRSAARAGVPELAARCRAAATRGTDPDPIAVTFLGVLGHAADLPTLQAALRRPELAKAAVAGLGALGTVGAVPIVLELMADEALGVAATAAYKRITGARDVEGEMPVPRPEVAEGEDECEDLPPDPAKAKRDWEARSKRMTADRAWQAGIAIPDAQLPAEFDALPLDSRRDVFLRLRARKQAPDRELEALAVRQGKA